MHGVAHMEEKVIESVDVQPCEFVVATQYVPEVVTFNVCVVAPVFQTHEAP